MYTCSNKPFDFASIMSRHKSSIGGIIHRGSLQSLIVVNVENCIWRENNKTTHGAARAATCRLESHRTNENEATARVHNVTYAMCKQWAEHRGTACHSRHLTEAVTSPNKCTLNILCVCIWFRMFYRSFSTHE